MSKSIDVDGTAPIDYAALERFYATKGRLDERHAQRSPTPTAPADPTTRLLLFQTRRKSLALAYLALVFLGPFGVHRFYVGGGAVPLGVSQLSALLMPLPLGLLLNAGIFGGALVWLGLAWTLLVQILD